MNTKEIVTEKHNSMNAQADEHIKNRKLTAQIFEKKKKTIVKLLEALRNIQKTEVFKEAKQNNTELNQQCDSLVQRLCDLDSKLENKIKLYKNGTITIAFCGTESAGKTTLLNKLSGLELPTDTKRCTAVPCEINHATEEEERFEVYYYSEEDLVCTINEQIEFINEKCKELSPSEKMKKIENVGEMSTWQCVNTDRLETGTLGKCLGAIKQLVDIKKCLTNETYRKILGTVETCKNLDSLSKYATSLDGTVEQQPLISIVKIYKNLKKELNHLRLYDTPGMSDPNPIAVKRTKQAAKSETDLLVIVGRRTASSSVTTELSEAIDKLEDADKELLNTRCVFLVNDADKTEGEKFKDSIVKAFHRKIKIYDDIFDIREESNALKNFQIYIYEKLLEVVPDHDKSLKAEIDREWRVIIDSIKKIYKELDLLPRNYGTQVISAKKNQLFDKWFNSEYDTSGADEVKHFLQKLRYGMRKIACHTQNGDSFDNILKVVVEERKKAIGVIDTWLKDEASEESCAKFKESNTRDPHDKLLSQLATHMTNIVYNITKEAKEIGGDIQNEISTVIQEALDVNIQEHTPSEKRPSVLLCGTSDLASERLDTLHEKISAGNNDKDVKFIARNLKEITQISQRVGYIMRYELRPALNLLDPFRWEDGIRRAERDKEIWKILCDSLNADERAQWSYVRAVNNNNGTTEYKKQDVKVKLEDKFTTVRGELMKCTDELLVKIVDIFKDADSSSDIGGMKESWSQRKYFTPFEQEVSARIYCLLWLKSVRRPNIDSSAASYHLFYKMLAYTALLTIDAVLYSKVNIFEKLKEDFLSDASQTLSTQFYAPTGWKNALRLYQKEILGDAWKALDSDENRGKIFSGQVVKLRRELEECGISFHEIFSA